MKLATCTVSLEGWRTDTGNKARIDLLRESIKKAKNEKTHLICFPGGYLFAKSKQSFKTLVRELEGIARQSKLFVAVGVDHDEKNLKRDCREKLPNEKLPFFAVCVGPRIKTRIWPQRSSTNEDQYDISPKLCSQGRSLTISGKTTEILMCGEIFNQKIRASILERKPDLAIDLGHLSQGFRVHAAMKVLAKSGVPTFCSVHAQTQKARKYCYIPGRKKSVCKSTNQIDFGLDGPPHLEFKIWGV